MMDVCEKVLVCNVCVCVCVHVCVCMCLLIYLVLVLIGAVSVAHPSSHPPTVAKRLRQRGLHQRNSPDGRQRQTQRWYSDLAVQGHRLHRSVRKTVTPVRRRQGETDRHNRHRQAGRQADRQTDRQTDRQRDRQTKIQTDTQKDKRTDKQEHKI